MIELFSDPTVWLGLLTLVVLEIVLGIDNLIFIAILADKLPEQQRDRARVIGLSLALLMRLALLASISWLVTLTDPLFEELGHSFSGRDVIMLAGGLFLLFKATMELHEPGGDPIKLERIWRFRGGSPTVFSKKDLRSLQLIASDATRRCAVCA